jgi:hypothetical protein
LDLDWSNNAFKQIRKEDWDINAKTPEDAPLRDIQGERYRSLFLQCIKGRVNPALIASLDSKKKTGFSLH